MNTPSFEYTSDKNITIFTRASYDTTIDLTVEGRALLQSLVQRAMNTWADAPAELKEFADLLLDGKIQQDYKSQS